ncbi:hypothetical protein [Streptomyces sp. NPDC048611]|uniref:hypothetical protein n=1 Tax=Streptomyces sp. NPDC048611 TaxID=3155635 RepID=UPI0034443B15
MNVDTDLAHLEWWANPSTCLARIPLTIEAIADDAWNATASPAFDQETREGLEFLLDLSPFATLRFKNDAVVDVSVGHSGDLKQLRLRAVSDTELP